MSIIEIGSTIEVTLTSGAKVTAVVQGRNWCYGDLVSYIVRYDFNDFTVCPVTLKSQILN